jgi:hypothetical protein
MKVNDAGLSVQADDFDRGGWFAGQRVKEKITGLEIGKGSIRERAVKKQFTLLTPSGR